MEQPSQDFARSVDARGHPGASRLNDLQEFCSGHGASRTVVHADYRSPEGETPYDFCRCVVTVVSVPDLTDFARVKKSRKGQEPEPECEQYNMTSIILIPGRTGLFSKFATPLWPRSAPGWTNLPGARIRQGSQRSRAQPRGSQGKLPGTERGAKKAVAAPSGRRRRCSGQMVRGSLPCPPTPIRMRKTGSSGTTSPGV